MLLALLVLLAPAAQDESVFHVAPHGNDAWSGRLPEANAAGTDGPFATPERARRAVRRAERGRDVLVLLDGGTYTLARTLTLEAADGARDDEHTVTWRARDAERVVWSGGALLDEWRVEDDGTWSHDLRATDFGRLFVSDRPRPVARVPQAGWLRAAAPAPDGRTGFTFEPGDLTRAMGTDGELLFLHDWSTSRVAIERVDEAERALVLAERIGAWHSFFHVTGFEPHPRYAIEGTRAGWDAPGEWLRDGARLHYRPLPGESPDATRAVVPARATLHVEGTADDPVRGLRFEGITFAHTNWARPTGGYAGIQAALHEGRAPGDEQREVLPRCAVEVRHATGCVFDRCRFEQLGSGGLWLAAGTRDALVRACTFTDIGANGLMLGAPDEATALVTDVVVEDCTVERCGAYCHGAVGIWVGIAASVTLRHNEVRELPYTGISLGWLWDPRPSKSRGHTIERNHVHHVMQLLSDGGGVYTIGRHADTRIAHNLIHDVPRHAGRAPSNGMFIDQGSSDLVIERNVIHDVAGASLRFHLAGRNTMRRNALWTTTPFEFNACAADTMVFEDNEVVLPGARAPRPPVELGVGPR